MRFHRRLSASALVLALAPLLALAGPQENDVAKVIELGRTESRVMEHLDHLANRIGPRLTGSDGFRDACEWARERFESFGLHNCRLEAWGEIPVGFNRGLASGRMLVPETKELHFGTNAWTAGTKGRVSGLAVMAPANEAELALVQAKLGGAWVVLPSARVGRGPDRAFRDKLEKLYESAGIAGTIRSGRGELIHTGGSSKIAWDKLPSRPAINLLAAEHKEIVDRLGAGEEVRLEFEVRNRFVKGPIPVHNVIAEIPGSEKSGELVIVGGHLDSWDGATGTTDNGTGVATTLEAARLLASAGVRPKRTIRFMLWGGEEQGLLGSRAYVKAHPEELPRISAVFVHDEGTNYCTGISVTPPMLHAMEAIFAPVANLDPASPFKVTEVPGLSGGGSDHASYLQAGVPAFFWVQKGSADYNHTHHTQFDTYDAAIPEYERNSSIVIAVGALGVANLPEILSRENLRAPDRGGNGGRRLGIELADDMTIDEVLEDGLAEKAGLRKGDRLVKVGDRPVGDRDELRSALREGPAKTKVVVQRNAAEIEIAVEFPPDSGPGAAIGRRLGLRLGEGLTIEAVTPGGAAEKAGFAAGDRIVKVGDAAVEGIDAFGETLPAGGGDAKVVVLRDGKETSVSLSVPARP